MEMTPKVYIFDLDGTLVNSLADLANACNFALRKMSFSEHRTEEYVNFVGQGIRHLITVAMPLSAQQDEAKIDECLSYFVAQYRTHCCENTRLYDEIEDLLRMLKKKNTKLAILSNKADELAKIVVSQLFAENTFDIVLGASDETPKKPSPAGALRICKMLGVEPSQTLFVGDSRFDIETAKNAQIKVAAVNWGFQSGETLLAHHPDFLVSRAMDLAEIEI